MSPRDAIDFDVFLITAGIVMMLLVTCPFFLDKEESYADRFVRRVVMALSAVVIALGYMVLLLDIAELPSI